jgi:hypothetical protein
VLLIGCGAVGSMSACGAVEGTTGGGSSIFLTAGVGAAATGTGLGGGGWAGVTVEALASPQTTIFGGGASGAGARGAFFEALKRREVSPPLPFGSVGISLGPEVRTGASTAEGILELESGVGATSVFGAELNRGRPDSKS